MTVSLFFFEVTLELYAESHVTRMRVCCSRLRSRIVNVKELHQYKYGDDTVCRCFGLGEDMVDHFCGGNAVGWNRKHAM